MVSRIKIYCGKPCFTAIRYYFHSLFIAIFLLTPAQAGAAEKTPDKLAVVMYELSPFYYLDSHGKPTGNTYDIVSHVLNSLDIPHDIAIMPLGRAIQEVSSGHYDLTSIYRVPELFPGLKFFGTVGCQQIGLMPVKASGITSLKDISGKRLTYVQGGRFDRLYSGSNKFIALPSPSSENMFRMAARGRVDAIIGNRMHLNSFRNNPTSLHLLPVDFWETLGDTIPIMPIESSFAISRKSRFQHIIPMIESFLKQESTQKMLIDNFIKYGEPTGGRCNVMKKNQISFSDALNGTSDEKIAEHQK